MSKEVIIYKSADGHSEFSVFIENETVWLSLDQMATLFNRDKSTVSRHIKNIFDEGELNANSVVVKNATTASDGKTYQVDYYNLDVIISVGYRVKSVQSKLDKLLQGVEVKWKTLGEVSVKIAT